MCLPKKILKWCSNHAKKHLRSKFKILCSVHSITIKINFNIFYHKIKALWIFIMCGLSKCLIRMKNNSASGIAQWRKIYLLLKMFGGHNTLLADALDGEKTQDFVNVLKRKKITWSRHNTLDSVTICYCSHHKNIHTLWKHRNKRAELKNFTTRSFIGFLKISQN